MNIALLEYFVMEHSILLLLVRKDLDEPLSYQIDIGEAQLNQHKAAFYQRVNQFNPNSYQPGLRKAIYQRQLADFYQLGEQLLTPCLDDLADIDLLYIVPHKALHYLPFHMMRVGEQYLIERFLVTYLPVSSLIKFCQQKNPYRSDKSKPKNPMLFASWHCDDERGGLVKQTHLDEVEQLGEHFSQKATVGLAASKQAFFDEVNDADLVHLATHGYFFDGDNVMETSGLSLSDGQSFAPSFTDAEQIGEHQSQFVSAHELLSCTFNQCHLVTLSTCSSAKSDNLAGDELMGLSRALFYAGAPTVLLTLWPVPVNSKLAFMRVFYRVWLKHQHKGKAYAFQQATLALLRNEDFKTPFHWGGYCLIGDWL